MVEVVKHYEFAEEDRDEMFEKLAKYLEKPRSHLRST